MDIRSWYIWLRMAVVAMMLSLYAPEAEAGIVSDGAAAANKDRLYDLSDNKDRHSDALFSDNSATGRACASRPQRVVSSHSSFYDGGGHKVASQSSHPHRRIYGGVLPRPEKRALVMASLSPVRRYYVIALRHLII